jgi:hypothetical protein
MDISTAILFIACLLFSGFSLFVNMKATRDLWLKLITLLFGLLGLLGAGYLLVVSFINYIK